MTAAGELALDGGQPARQLSRIEANVARVGPHRHLDPWRGELEHPPKIFRCDEVPGWTQHVRPQDLTVRERPLDVSIRDGVTHPQPDAPLRKRELLRLDGAELCDQRADAAAKR